MSEETRERRIQEYLDGRMPDGEREEFESGLDRDPELAARVRDALEMRKVLRDSPVDLPPGFHERTRERFEASRRGWAPLRNLVSWEAAGLAAAVLVLAAILTPFVLQRGLLVPDAGEPDVYRKPASEPAGGDEFQERAKAADAPGTAEYGIEGAELEKVEADAAETRDDVSLQAAPERAEEEPPASYAPSPPPPAPAQVEKSMRAGKGDSEPSRRQQAEPRTDRRPEEKRAAATGESEGFLSEARPADGRESHPKKRKSSDGLVEIEELGDSRPGAVTTIVRSVTLPGGAIPPGSIRIIGSAENWDRFLESPGAEAARSLAPDFLTDRVVLAGPVPDPWLCGEASYRVEQGRLRIDIPRGPSGSEQNACVLLVPAEPAEMTVHGVTGPPERLEP